MKTTKRGWLMVLACVLLVAALACLPLFWFRTQDASMFGSARQEDSLYESRTVTGDNFYLLQQAKNRTQATLTSWQIPQELNTSVSMYSPAGNSRSEMTLSVNAASFAANLLSQLNEAGALPDAWYHAAADDLNSYGYELYTSSDSLGITRVLRFSRSAYDVESSNSDECPIFALDYDNKTGGLLALWIQAPLDQSQELRAGSAKAAQSPLLDSLDTTALLNSWVQWEGLSDLNDWTAPLGSDYADTGLYSASGNALLTCVTGTFSLDDTPRAYYSMQLNWMPYTPAPQPGDPALLPDTAVPDIVSAYYTDVSAFRQDESGRYEIDYNSSLILRTDLQTGVQDVFCNIPGCTHTTDSCPARLTGSSFSLTAADDCVYLVSNGFASTLAASVPGQDASSLSDDELMRWVQATNSGIPLALYTQELEPYTPEDVAAARSWLSNILDQSRIEVLDGTTRKELAHLDGQALTISYCDDTYLYGLLQDHTATQPLRWFRMDRTTGQYETFFLPDSSELCGVWENQLVLLREHSREPLHTDSSLALTTIGSVDSETQNTASEIILYDPATAQSRRLYTLPGTASSIDLFTRYDAVPPVTDDGRTDAEAAPDGQLSGTEIMAYDFGTSQYLQLLPSPGYSSDITPLALYDDCLYVGLSVWNGPLSAQEYVFRISLTTGEQTDISAALGLPQTAYLYDYFLSAPSRWLSYVAFSSDGSVGDTVLFDLASGRLTHNNWQSYAQCSLAAETPDSRVLLLHRNADSSYWHQSHQQYLAPANDLNALTPVVMWEPGA